MRDGLTNLPKGYNSFFLPTKYMFYAKGEEVGNLKQFN